MNTVPEKIYSNLDDEYNADGLRFRLRGNYGSNIFYNTHPDVANLERLPQYHCKAVFRQGNVLYKLDEPNAHIKDLIDLAIRYTYTEPRDRPNINNNNLRVMRYGTICPSIEDIYKIDGKVISLYGRYIFGVDYDEEGHTAVIFESCNKKENHPQIVLDGISNDNNPHLDDYNYAFTIIDNTTEVLYAFGLYR